MRSVLLVAVLALSAIAQPPEARASATWKLLAERYDADRDGTITAKEYPRGDRAFLNLDRNGDGMISEVDFRRPPRRPGATRRGAGAPSAEVLSRRLADYFGPHVNVDGKLGLSRAEWKRFVDQLRFDAHGVLETASLQRFLGEDTKAPMGRMAGRFLSRGLDADGNGRIEKGDLEKLFATIDRDGNGILDQDKEIVLPPGVGEMAPDFDLPLVGDAKKTVKLSSFRKDRPVVLIFGSYT